MFMRYALHLSGKGVAIFVEELLGTVKQWHV